MIYFIQNEKNLNIKIGYTSNIDVRKRLHVLQVGSSDILRLVGVRRGTIDLEQRLHCTFRETYIRGEWFSLTKELVTYIKSETIISKYIDYPDVYREGVLKRILENYKEDL